MVLTPYLGDLQSLGRNIVFLLDRSGSMSGAPMDAAREALVMALQQLTPKDNFSICQFDDQMVWYQNDRGRSTPTLVQATPNNLEAAQVWVREAESRGLTDILAPMQASVDGLHNAKKGQVRNTDFPAPPVSSYHR